MDINLQCPINFLGYGIVGTNIYKALAADPDIGVSLFPIGPVECSQENVELVKKGIERSQKFNLSAHSVRLYHQNSLAESVGKLRVGFPIFELEDFDDIEKHHLRSLDLILVPSRWAQGVVQRNLGERCPVCKVVPLGVDTSVFKPNDPPLTVHNFHKPTVFLNVGKWEVRKGHDVLIEAFCEAFPDGDENVELWMMPTNPFLDESSKNAWESIYRSDKRVRIIPRQPTHEGVANVMAKADCGVFPARAEGWNLELLEMMAMGKHVIATNLTAHTEFCNGDNAMLINPGLAEPSLEVSVDPYMPQFGFNGRGGRWAVFDKAMMNDLIQWLRVYHHRQHHLGVNEKGIETARYFSWQRTAATLKYAIWDFQNSENTQT